MEAARGDRLMILVRWTPSMSGIILKGESTFQAEKVKVDRMTGGPGSRLEALLVPLSVSRSFRFKILSQESQGTCKALLVLQFWHRQLVAAAASFGSWGKLAEGGGVGVTHLRRSRGALTTGITASVSMAPAMQGASRILSKSAGGFRGGIVVLNAGSFVVMDI